VAKGTKLKLKGSKNVPSKKKKRKAAEGSEEAADKFRILKLKEDTAKHGGWWAASKFDDISGIVAVEFGDGSYVKCLDDGTFTLGAPHGDGDPPAPEEVFTAIRINDEKIALKSGYGKYLASDKDGKVIGRSDAVGPVEQWEVVFEEGKMALLSHSGCFMSVDPSEETVVCKSRKAGPAEILKLRCGTEKKVDEASLGPAEERGSIKDIELNYVKKFQKFQDKRTRLCTEDIEDVKKAQGEGNLHETLLDRRSKMKADRYCK